MTVTILPSLAHGSVTAPPSKSVAHRALFAAALCEGESTLSPIALSEDMLATMDALGALGASFSRSGDTVRVKGIEKLPGATGEPLCCRESGSTLRFVLPLCLLCDRELILRGSARLMERPLDVYETLCKENGFLFEKKKEEIRVRGKLLAGEYKISGEISSQFITGMLFALSLLEGESILHVTGKMESASYVDMTLDALRAFGVEICREGQDFFIPAFTRFSPRAYRIEGDWSNAAFLLALSSVGGNVSVEGMEADSCQGDRVCVEMIRKIESGCPTLCLSDCPDLGPVLFALAAYHNGAVFEGVRRLRLKESDRALAMAQELKKCGVDLILEEDRITVPGGCLRAPTEPIFGHNDHRIVMAMSVLLSRLGGSIRGAEAVAKSYPDFFAVLKKLGIEVMEDETE